jgi:hypothetical protein
MDAEAVLQHLARTGKIDDKALAEAQAAVDNRMSALQVVDGVIEIPSSKKPSTAAGPKIPFRLEGREKVYHLTPVDPTSLMFLMRRIKHGDLAMFQGTMDIIERAMGEDDFAEFADLVSDPESGVGVEVVESIFTILTENSAGGAKRPIMPSSVSSGGRSKTNPGSKATSSKPASGSKKSVSKSS